MGWEEHTHHVENDVYAVGLAHEGDEGGGDRDRVDGAGFDDDTEDGREGVVRARKAGALPLHFPYSVREETLYPTSVIIGGYRKRTRNKKGKKEGEKRKIGRAHV